MTRRDRLEMAAWWLLIAAMMALILVTNKGCTAKRVEVIAPDGTRTVIESYGLLAGHQLQAGEYVSGPTTRRVKIEGYGQDVDAAKVVGQAVIESLKKVP